MALIRLPLDTGERSFAGIRELSGWYKRECQAFAWLHESPCNEDGELEETRNVVENWLNGVQNFAEQYRAHGRDKKSQQQLMDETVKGFHRIIRRGQLITSESADAQFVFGLRNRDKDEHSTLVAAYALGFLLRAPANYLSVAALEGTYRALQYRQGDNETVPAQQKALEASSRDFTARFDQQYDEAIQKNQELTSIQGNISKKWTTQEDKFDKFMANAKTRIESIADIYDKKLALQSSITYWKGKGKRHKKLVWIMGVLSVLSALVTAAAFAWFSYDLLDKPLSEITPWAFGVLFVISTFGIWLTRMLTKMFVSNLHLGTDADERVTMIQTYLAMLRDKNSPARGQEQLILAVLFRPSVAGYIKEEGPAALHDALSKLAAEHS